MLPRILPTIISIAFIFLFLIFVCSLVLHFVDFQEDLELRDEVFHSAPYDIFIFSTYFYNNSKSLGESAIAILMTGDFEILERLPEIELLGLNSTDRVVVKSKLERVTPHDACKWITMLTTVPLLPNLSQLFVSLGGKHAPIPFEVISTTPKPVVMCISPLFASESWQNLLLALHVYKKFGAHMQLYIRSIVSPILEILRTYESEGYVSIKSWNRINLLNRHEVDFNPNLNVEFRSQAASQTDCLLKYKESSEYVAFIDLDDLMIPRLADSYLGEFRFFTAENPQVSYFHYKKENVATKGNKRANTFSVSQMLRGITFKQIQETGKMVAVPSKLNATWIHWPNNEQQILKFQVPVEMNSITHLKHIEMVEGMEKNGEIVPKYEPSVKREWVFGAKHLYKPLITDKNLKIIEKDYKRISWKSSVRRHLRNLPLQMKYSKMIGKCFYSTYYKYHEDKGIESKMLCPGPERCDLSSHASKCWNSVGEYHSTREGDLINIHFVENSDFLISDSCIV